MFPYTKYQNAALLLLRLIIAAVFIFAGIGKFPFWSGVPEGYPVLSGGMLMLTKFLSIVEPLGALGLIVGFLTRWAAAGLAIIMVGAICMLHFMMGSSFFTMQAPGIDYNTLLLAGSVILAAFGAGNWSLDRLWRKKV